MPFTFSQLTEPIILAMGVPAYMRLMGRWAEITHHSCILCNNECMKYLHIALYIHVSIYTSANIYVVAIHLLSKDVFQYGVLGFVYSHERQTYILVYLWYT